MTVPLHSYCARHFLNRTADHRLTAHVLPIRRTFERPVRVGKIFVRNQIFLALKPNNTGPREFVAKKTRPILPRTPPPCRPIRLRVPFADMNVSVDGLELNFGPAAVVGAAEVFIIHDAVLAAGLPPVFHGRWTPCPLSSTS